MFQGCGPPRLGRSKRHASVDGELSQEFLDFRASIRQDKKRDKEMDTIIVSRHVHEIKTKVSGKWIIMFIASLLLIAYVFINI